MIATIQSGMTVFKGQFRIPVVLMLTVFLLISQKNIHMWYLWLSLFCTKSAITTSHQTFYSQFSIRFAIDKSQCGMLTCNFGCILFINETLVSLFKLNLFAPLLLLPLKEIRFTQLRSTPWKSWIFIAACSAKIVLDPAKVTTVGNMQIK